MQLHQALKLMPQMILDYVQRKKLQGDVIAKQLQEAKVGLEQAILRSQRATMNSPIDGVVLDRPVFNEQYLRAGTVLLTIARLQDMEVESDVLTQEAAGIHVDDPTEVYGPAIGAPVGQGVRGKVKRVSPDAFTKVSSLGVEEQRANVVIAIDDAAKLVQQRPALGFGFRVRVRIYTSTKEDALTIPRAALLRGGRANQWQLFVIRGGRAVLQDVDVGLMNEQSAEVTKGLDEGQQVVLAPESNLSAGMRVSVQSTSGEPGFDKGVIDE
jgi:HlyD family secretion protein